VNNVIGDTVRHSLEALGPVTICDGQHRVVFANQAMMAMRAWDDGIIGRSVWTTCDGETRKIVEPHWRDDPPDQVLYLPEGHALNEDGSVTNASAVGMWIPYNDGVNIGRVRVSAAQDLSEAPTERSLRNALGIAVQAVQLGQLRMAYDETVHVARGAKEALANIRVRLAHALRGLDGNPEGELYELRQLVADLAVILQRPTAPVELSSRDAS
jgi:hypothetical protein